MQFGAALFGGVFVIFALGALPNCGDAPRSNDVTLASTLPIEARLLDAAGAPLANRAVAVTIAARPADSRSQPPHIATVQSDAAGRVALSAPRSMTGATLLIFFSLIDDPLRACWSGSTEATDTSTTRRLGDVTLRPPRRPVPNDSVRNARGLDDAQLERLLGECLDRLLEKPQLDPRLSGYLLEVSRRGGPRWREFLETRVAELKRHFPAPQRHSEVWVPVLDALRFLQGRPLLGKVLIHPEDRDGRPRAALEQVRFEVVNMDPEETIELLRMLQIVRFEALDPEGKPAPRQPPVEQHWSVPGDCVSLPPGQVSSRSEGLWYAQLSDDYALPEGDWTVRLLYSPCNSIDPFTGTSDLPLFESDPFIVRIRK